MHRDALLAVAIAVLFVVAGCLGPTGSPGTTTTAPTTTTSTTATTTDATTTTTASDGHYRRYTFRASEITPSALARDYVPTPDGLYLDDQAFESELFENGSARAVAVVHADHAEEMEHVGPIEDGTYVRLAGTYYRVNESVLDRRETRGYRVELEGPLRREFHGEEYDRAKREAVNYSALSTADRRLFRYVVPPGDELDSAVTSSSRVWAFPRDADPANSTLVDGETHYVRYDGHLFRVGVDVERPPVVRYRLHYELREVAGSADAFLETRAERLVTPLNDSVPDPERSVLLRAIDESRFEWEGTHRTVPPEYEAAEAWLYEHPPEGRVAYVRYEGRLYRIDLRKVRE